MIQLSKRLQAVADWVPLGARVADIGSDHAKLALWLVENGRSDFVIAGEVALGPFNIAREATKNSAEIEVRLGNGLSVLKAEDAIDTLVIAGMGGLLIREILSSPLPQTIQRLILQPNNEEAELRCFLTQIRWQLVNEKILEDKGKIYEILQAQLGLSELTADELKFGKRLSGSIFVKKWQQRLAEINKVLKLAPQRTDLVAEKIQIEKRLSHEDF